jgi:hypothetical protein
MNAADTTEDRVATLHSLLNDAAKTVGQQRQTISALREALNYAHQLEECVAEFLDAYTAFNNDELDEVSLNDAEHSMKIAMYEFRRARGNATGEAK